MITGLFLQVCQSVLNLTHLIHIVCWLSKFRLTCAQSSFLSPHQPGVFSARSVTSAVEFVGLIHRGVKLRVQHPTLVHQNSSRSHLVVTATLTTASSLGSTGKLTLVPGQFKVSKSLPENHRGASLGIAWDQVSIALSVGCLAYNTPPRTYEDKAHIVKSQ